MEKKKNHKFFYKNWFYVKKGVFLPRFETEQLVDLTINYGKNLFDNEIEILEIGTGSGVIAISLASASSHWKVDAVDIDQKAIDLAKENQKLLQVQSVNFWCSNMFDKIEKKYDLIIANLPYVPNNSKLIDPDILQWDPERALFAKENGIQLIRIFLEKVQTFLKNKFLIALEIGFGQCSSIIRLIKKIMPKSKIQISKDFNKIERFIFIYQNP